MKQIALLTLGLVFTLASILKGQPSDKLVVHFPMNDKNDEAFAENDFSRQNPINLKGIDREGNQGCALYFEDNSFFFKEGSGPFGLKTDGEKTISLWYKSLIDFNSGILTKLFGVEKSNANYYGLYTYDGFQPIWSVSDGYIWYGEDAGFVADTNWHHLVGVYKNKTLISYYDGQFVGVDFVDGITIPSANVIIGSYFHGYIDDIYVYDKALEGQDIIDLYNAPASCESLTPKVRVVGRLFNDFNMNNVFDENDYYLDNFKLEFQPSGKTVLTDLDGYFTKKLDSGSIETITLPIVLQNEWNFSVVQDPIDLTDYTAFDYYLNDIGVYKKPPKKITISGRLFDDFDGNNLFDGTDFYLDNFPIEFQPSGISASTNALGEFSVDLDSGSIQTLSIPFSQSDWTFSVVQNPIDLNNYDQPTYDLGDIGLMLFEENISGSFATSFPATLPHSRNAACNIVLKNDGNVALNGELKVNVTGNQLFRKFVFPANYSEASLDDSTLQYTFQVDDLMPSDVFAMGFTLFSQAPVNSKIHIDYVYTDISGYSIQGSYVITVIAPHDPNYIAVDHEEIYKQFINEQRQLSYTVHFQNLGNAIAENVVVRQQLPPELKSDYIYVIGASASVVLEKINSGNSTELVWHFKDINLASITDDSLASTGYISFSMFPEALEKDDSIVLDADIYFDAQDAVHTNDAITTLVCKGIVGQNMIDFHPFDALCFGEATGGVLMQANIDTAELNIVLNNGNIIHYSADSLLLAAGNYVVKTTDELGCTQSQNFSVKQPSKLNSSIIEISEVEKELLIGGGTPPYSILWSNGYIGYELDKLPVGSNTYIITDANGCTVEGTFEQSTLSKNNSTLSDIKVYPNPSNSLLNVEWPKSNYSLTILDLQGRKLREFTNIVDKTVLDISDMTPQVYVIKLTSNAGLTRIFRIIKQ